MRSKSWIVLALFALVGLTGCEIEVPGGEFITPTPVSRGPTPTPVIIGRPTINPTDTPRPLPPTPTPRPSPTPPPPTPTPEEPTPTSQPQEQETATAAEPGATDTPTPVPTDTPPPQVGTTEMVLIPAGPFIMGSNADDPDETPQREVDLPAFEIDLFEVTNAQFAAFVETTGYQTDEEKGGAAGWRSFYTEGKDNHPAVKASWNDAVAYCQWAGKRLPTEAEWEKAARGTDGRLYPWGNTWSADRCHAGLSPPQSPIFNPYDTDHHGLAEERGPVPGTRGQLPGRRQPLRLPGHGRQCLGMDGRLVRGVLLPD